MKDVVNNISEFFLYLAVFGLAFSNALNEIAVYIIIFLFLIKILSLKYFPKTKINNLLWAFAAISLLSFIRSHYPAKV